MNNDVFQKELEQERAGRLASERRVAELQRELEALKTQALRHDDAGQTIVHAHDRLTQLIANLQNGILAVDEHRKVVIANELFCRQFGIKAQPSELIGNDGEEMIRQIGHLFRKPDNFAERVGKLIAKKETVLNDELELLTGQVFSRDYIPLFSGGEYRGHMWKYTDVTRGKTIEATFEAQRKFYEQILNGAPADIVVCTNEYRYLYLNPVAVSDPELRKWMIGKTVEDYYRHVGRPAADAESRRAFFNLVLDSKVQQEREEKLVDERGNTNYYLRNMYPVLDDKGAVEMVIGYGVDITERKKIEEQIKQSEKRYREIFDFSQAWICTHDLLGRILTVNPAACKIMDYAPHELRGKSIEAFIPERFQPEFTGIYMNSIISHGKAEGIMNILTRKRKNIYLLYQNFLVNEPDSEPYIIGFAQNITERIHAEEELKRSEEKYRGIIDNMNLGMIEIDQEEKIIFANQRFCTMSGYELDELVTKTATDLFLRGSSLKKTRTRLSKGKYGITNSYELAIRTKDGEERWWLTSAAPVFGEGGQVKGTIGIHLDITEKKKLAKQLQESKLSAERLSKSKDIFLANMSHEIRTPLNAIMGLGKLLVKGELSAKQKSYLSGIESASGSLLAIINDLLDFSKIEAGKITIESIGFSLGSIVSQVINILNHKAEEKGLVLSADVDSRIAPVLMGDPYRVNQVFMNLLSNAIKFTEKGSISLSAQLLAHTDGHQQIRVVVKDTGIGIKQDYLDKLFEKFTQEDETVERKFGGTGLGMTITKQLMDLMGGTITVESEKNKGTMVALVFNFPVGEMRAIEKKRALKNDTRRIDGKKVLLVEDNSLNRLLAFTILAEYGAVITEAENGAEAVACMRKETFDLVLMDIQMPVMDGIRATQVIRQEISSNIPVIALTANAIKGREEEFLENGMNDFIVKPYTEMNLVNCVAKWLGKARITNDEDVVVPEAEHEAVPEPVAAEKQQADVQVMEEPLYDLSKLLVIARNDETFIVKMMQLFISETALGLAKLNEAYETDDLKMVKYYAHRMKPSIGNLGIGSIKQEVVDIELITERTPELARKLALVSSTLGLVIAQLKVEFKLH